jgi:hypothetical protein
MNGNGFIRIVGLLFWTAVTFPHRTCAADVPKAPVPKSPYLPVIYRYADTMLERGRDSYGPQKTGLFLSALDRTSLSPLTNRPAAPAGLREADRVGNDNDPLAGANPEHDQNFLRLLYTLSELSGKAHYRQAADAELKWFLENAASSTPQILSKSPAAQSLPCVGRMSWNVLTDEPVPNAGHDCFRAWLLWDRCFSIAAEASKQFAPGLQKHPFSEIASKRRAGGCIRTWAVAFAHTKEPEFLKSIEMLLDALEKNRDGKTRLIGSPGGETNASVESSLSLAIDCDGAAQHVPEPLASREDEFFCSLPHGLKITRGFVTDVPANSESSKRHTSLWKAGDGGSSTACAGMMCVSRYDNTGKVAYRDLILAAADAYLNSQPENDRDAWPLTFGHAISLQVAAWRHSAKPAYLESARKIADLAVEKFWGTNALPRASFKSEHYETRTGADTLALALVELHLHILHITAVRCPPNTIDR